MNPLKSAILSLVAGGIAFSASMAEAKAEGLSGTWNGGGIIQYQSGGRERARCRVRFIPQSASSYIVNASCASESGRIDQDAVVRRASENVYVGNFFSQQYNVGGSIHISVRGNHQTATLRSQSGSAVLSLSR